MPAAAASVAAPDFAGPLSVIFIAGSAEILGASWFCCAGAEELVTLLLSASVAGTVGGSAVAIVASWRRLEGRFQWIRCFCRKPISGQTVSWSSSKSHLWTLRLVEVRTRKAVRRCNGVQKGVVLGCAIKRGICELDKFHHLAHVLWLATSTAPILRLTPPQQAPPTSHHTEDRWNRHE